MQEDDGGTGTEASGAKEDDLLPKVKDFSKSIVWKWLILGFTIGFAIGALLGYNYSKPYELHFSMDDAYCTEYCSVKNSTVSYELVNNKQDVCYCDRRLKERNISTGQTIGPPIAKFHSK